MFNISSATAYSIYYYSNIALIFGTTIALIATIAAIYSSSIIEQYSNERTATNERLTIVAKAEAAKATENAAIAWLKQQGNAKLVVEITSETYPDYNKVEKPNNKK